MSKMVHQAGFSYFDDGYKVASQTAFRIDHVCTVYLGNMHFYKQ